MSTYLLTFIKHIPVRVLMPENCAVTREEPWQTTITADGQEEAEQTAFHIGQHIRQRLAKGYDIALESVDFID